MYFAAPSCIHADTHYQPRTRALVGKGQHQGTLSHETGPLIPLLASEPVNQSTDQLWIDSSIDAWPLPLWQLWQRHSDPLPACNTRTASHSRPPPATLWSNHL